MDGVFGKRGGLRVYNIVGLVSGVFLALMFGFVLCADRSATLDDRGACWFFLCFGLFVSIFCGVCLYVDRRAYIHVDEQGISAFCHVGLRLKCGLSDIRHVSYDSMVLNIQLKSGRKYILLFLENPYPLWKYISKRISVEPTLSLDKEQLISMILPLNRKRKWEGSLSITGLLLTIPGILLTAALTGRKEIYEFGAGDWTVFAIMAGIGVVVVVVSFLLLGRNLRDTNRLKKAQETLYLTLLRTEAVLPGNAIQLLINDDIHNPFRVTIFGCPNSDDVYFTVEKIDQSYELKCDYTSIVFADIDELKPMVDELTEIPLP